MMYGSIVVNLESFYVCLGSVEVQLVLRPVHNAGHIVNKKPAEFVLCFIVTDNHNNVFCIIYREHAPRGRRHPLSPFFLCCPFTSSSFALFYFIRFSFSHPLYLFSSFVHSFLSTRIVPLYFQAGGHRRRPNLGLVFLRSFCAICIAKLRFSLVCCCIWFSLL